MGAVPSEPVWRGKEARVATTLEASEAWRSFCGLGCMEWYCELECRVYAQWKGIGSCSLETPGMRQSTIGFQKRSHQQYILGIITLRFIARPRAMALCTSRRCIASMSRWRLGLRSGIELMTS